MKLSKDDIKHIACHRFHKSHQKHFYGLVYGGLALLVGLTLPLARSLPEKPQIAMAVAIVIFILMFVGLFLYNRALDKATKSFTEECEANPTLTYVPEVANDAQKATN